MAKTLDDNTEHAFKNIIDALSTKQVVLFLGAGVSCEAGGPSGKKLICRLKRAFPLIDLEPLVKDKGLYLLQGCFQEDGSFYTGSDFDIYLLPIEEPQISNYCVLIWNESDKVISDILWLPPYYEEGFEPSTDSRKYNESSHGQRFLRIAILVGVFGYCQNCFFVPLIPSGGHYKCYRDSIKVLCPICGFSKSLSKFDSCMFPPESEELREDIISSLNSERSILALKFN